VIAPVGLRASSCVGKKVRTGREIGPSLREQPRTCLFPLVPPGPGDAVLAWVRDVLALVTLS
jgi:hypothetical protein